MRFGVYHVCIRVPATNVRNLRAHRVNGSIPSHPYIISGVIHPHPDPTT